jgi:hypothetical protein
MNTVLCRLSSILRMHDILIKAFTWEFHELTSIIGECRDAVQFLLDTTAHKHSTNSPAGSKVDHGNRSNILKTNVRKDSGDSLGTTQPAPLRASWADVKPNITPFKLYLADASLKCGLPEKSSNGKNGMAQFKSYGIDLSPVVKSCLSNLSCTVLLLSSLLMFRDFKI